MFADRILRLGKKFKGRLEDMWVETVLDYVDHGEWGGWLLSFYVIIFMILIYLFLRRNMMRL